MMALLSELRHIHRPRRFSLPPHLPISFFPSHTTTPRCICICMLIYKPRRRAPLPRPCRRHVHAGTSNSASLSCNQSWTPASSRRASIETCSVQWASSGTTPGWLPQMRGSRWQRMARKGSRRWTRREGWSMRRGRSGRRWREEGEMRRRKVSKLEHEVGTGWSRAAYRDETQSNGVGRGRQT
ncbi:hypothetical protein M427DRAFT_235443 [Gonapodya prolifera JEL478]|uniref:Uncharacterized protein n=1 Tax=Gonapodya prolifera (strain JEL478) TaxID=1344416 RepID=A0A139AMD1_GONPJ|nr:hypothetical protein M427DRAFT_235443 [Gonapodya prolifera JEL478]|eukprot:KXS17922.1 hypothetical protein M427DRAFT_235443 [Gonapodya prolifera JEL478]